MMLFSVILNWDFFAYVFLIVCICFVCTFLFVYFFSRFFFVQIIESSGQQAVTGCSTSSFFLNENYARRLSYFRSVDFFLFIKQFMFGLSVLLGFKFVYYAYFCFDKTVFWYQSFSTISFLYYGVGDLTLGIDGISFPLVFLTIIIMPISISLSNVVKFPVFYYSCLLMLEAVVLIGFCTDNLFLFYISLEVSTVLMFFIIGIWGSRSRKILASYYLMFYTLIGSFLFLTGILLLAYSPAKSVNFVELVSMTSLLSTPVQHVIWWLFFLAFVVKIPLFPFHLWLPEAHVEAPTAGSVILASLLLKLGVYGMFRYVILLFPLISQYYTPYVYTLCVCGLVFSSIIATRQLDMKKLVAYSSVAHMSVVVLGLFSFTQTSLEGALYTSVAHGFSTGVLFLLIGILYDIYGSREVTVYGGLKEIMPMFSFFFLIASFANMGFPGTGNFIGEILIMVGLFQYSVLVAIFAATGSVLGAIYSIYFYTRVSHGNVNTNNVYSFYDLQLSDFIHLVTLTFFILFFGLFPNILLEFSRVTITYYLTYLLV